MLCHVLLAFTSASFVEPFSLRLPVCILQGPGGIWCDVDVVEFSYYGTPAVAPKEQVYTELVEGLRGNDSRIGPGSQVQQSKRWNA